MSGASGGKLFSFFGGGREDKYQDAADRYIEAANAFKMQNRGGSFAINARPKGTRSFVVCVGD